MRRFETTADYAQPALQRDLYLATSAIIAVEAVDNGDVDATEAMLDFAFESKMLNEVYAHSLALKSKMFETHEFLIQAIELVNLKGYHSQDIEYELEVDRHGQKSIVLNVSKGGLIDVITKALKSVV